MQQIALEQPLAVFIGGDLVFEGHDMRTTTPSHVETKAWADARIPVFPALGNHELRDCDTDVQPCLDELVDRPSMRCTSPRTAGTR